MACPTPQWLLWLDVWARSPRNPSVDAHRRELEARWIAGYAGIVERIAMVEHELLALA